VSGFVCPECDEPAPAGTRAGAPYACTACGNPVLPVEAPAAVAPRAASRASWKVGVGVFVALALAYVGLYLLLTSDASGVRDRLLAQHGPAIAAFPNPGTAPGDGDAAAFRAWREAKARHDDRLLYERKSARVDALFVGLLCAFGAQVAFTALLVVRSALARRAAVARATRASARSSAPRGSAASPPGS
jgi:hypothetical protein